MMSKTARATFIPYLYSAEEASSRDEIYSGTTIWLKVGSNSSEHKNPNQARQDKKSASQKTQDTCVGV
jgi:hypothetical protein